MGEARRFAYVGIRACGCCVAACVDTDPKRSAKFTGDLIRKGYTVERHPVEWVRENLAPCTCNKVATASPTQETLALSSPSGDK